MRTPQHRFPELLVHPDLRRDPRSAARLRSLAGHSDRRLGGYQTVALQVHILRSTSPLQPEQPPERQRVHVHVQPALLTPLQTTSPAPSARPRPPRPTAFPTLAPGSRSLWDINYFSPTPTTIRSTRSAFNGIRTHVQLVGHQYAAPFDVPVIKPRPPPIAGYATPIGQIVSGRSDQHAVNKDGLAFVAGRMTAPAGRFHFLSLPSRSSHTSEQ